MDNRLKAYQQAETLGKSQIDLVLQVYDGAIAAYTAAGECYQSNDMDGGYKQMERARKFITHLYTTLDFEKGQEVAENLGKLYAFIITQTDLAQATKEQKIIRSNIEVLKNLREGWAGIKSQALPQKANTSDDSLSRIAEASISTSG